jgi:hypothetical protein
MWGGSERLVTENWQHRATEDALRAQLDEAAALLRQSLKTTLVTYEHPDLRDDIDAFLDRVKGV